MLELMSASFILPQKREHFLDLFLFKYFYLHNVYYDILLLFTFSNSTSSLLLNKSLHKENVLPSSNSNFLAGKDWLKGSVDRWSLYFPSGAVREMLKLFDLFLFVWVWSEHQTEGWQENKSPGFPFGNFGNIFPSSWH